MMPHLTEMHSERRPHALDEQAVPSYIHANAIISNFYWGRIWKVINFLENIRNENVLDFGCGAGILFPFLASRCKSVTAFDVDITSAREMIQRLRLSGIHICSDLSSLHSSPATSFDTILALNVLEHVDNLPELSVLFKRLAKIDGKLIVSGPTESWIYKVGRRIAGYRYHFHVRSIYDVERELVRYFRGELLAELYPGITFFRISSWTPR